MQCLISQFRLFFVLTMLIAGSVQGQQFPMQVYVAEEGAAVRGGPGEAYYSTLQLKSGDELTVYRADGDWYAIRPPRGSFSLVSANAIADRGDGTGEVIRQGAASRVGSSVVDMQDTVHVRLEKGEPVQILGSQTREGVKWLRIEPPRGEFRWVHRGDVSSSPVEVVDRVGATGSASAIPPMVGQRPQAQDNTGIASGTQVLPMAHNGSDRYAAPPLAGETEQTWAARSDVAQPLPPPAQTNSATPLPSGASASPLSATPLPLGATALPSGATGTASALPPQGNTAAQPIGNTGISSGTPPITPLAPLQPSAQQVPPSAINSASGMPPTNSAALEPLKSSGPVSSAAPAPTTDDAFARQMFVMEVELGRIVAEPPAKWNLGGMEQEARRLLTTAQTEQQRQAVQALSARLERFAAIRRQYELLPPVDTVLASRAPRTTPGVPNTVAQSVSDASGNSNSDPRYDAMGLLRPVASKRPDAPKYALVNESGQIITFVTPAPDVNLQPYLGRLVGVNGTRGYMAEFNHRHVTAGRVMPVNDRMVR